MDNWQSFIQSDVDTMHATNNIWHWLIIIFPTQFYAILRTIIDTTRELGII